MSRQNEQLFIWLLIGIPALWLIIRLFPLMRFFMLILIFIALVLLVWTIVRQVRKQRTFEKSPSGQIVRRIQYCVRQVEKNEQELKDAQKQIEELQTELRKRETSPGQRKETEKLIAAFQDEVRLREAKISFFDSAIRKLEDLAHHHHLSAAIEEKKQKLRKMRESHFDEIAEMEELRSEVETDTLVLKTIEELSERMFASVDAGHAESILSELDKMTREINRP
ncbi:MAG TPA: hypothetical protein PKE06_25000 [Flavilitoribacter sp.]|nr:hypothetical protein [Flavilitoribacter sp.]HMQ88153.1 hypothetical protein [Flavilitoribacter sp.]